MQDYSVSLSFHPTETPPVEKLNLSELVQRSLDLSGEWPNEEEKLRFERLRGELLKAEEAEWPASGAAQPAVAAVGTKRGAAQRQASPAAQVTAARTARQEELLEDADHLNTGHHLHWQACVWWINGICDVST